MVIRMADNPLAHPLKWWQFYVASFRYAGSGLLGVIGDASTVLGMLLFAAKYAAPTQFLKAASYLKAHGYRDDLLIAIPLLLGGGILLARLLIAPFVIYRDKAVPSTITAQALQIDPASIRDLASAVQMPVSNDDRVAADLDAKICHVAFGPTDSPLETLVLFDFVFNCSVAFALRLTDWSLEVTTGDGERPFTDRSLPLLPPYIVPNSWATHEHWDSRPPTDRSLTIKDDLYFTTWPMRRPNTPMPQFGLTSGLLCFTVDVPIHEVSKKGTKFYLYCRDSDGAKHPFARYTVREQPADVSGFHSKPKQIGSDGLRRHDA